jgi:cellulose synthase/poly-beta-1,6-N-acetylglucosamine synthase-like glycosyltransferase/4-amino-4-deoxy-L-arabinose transferase-like glycosyltransferase
MSAEPVGSFSVTVPAHGDETLLEATLADLVTGDELPAEVLVVVRADDPRTRDAAQRAAGRHPQLVELVDQAAVSDGITGEASYEHRQGRSSHGRLASWGAKESWLALRAAATVWRSARASPAVALTAAAAGRVLERGRDLGLVGLPAFVAAAAVVVATLRAGSLDYLPIAALSFVLAVIAWKALVRIVDAQRAPSSPTETDRCPADPDGTASFSVTVPAHRDEAVLDAMVSEFVTDDDQPFEVVIVVDSDDPATRGVAERVANRHPHLVNVVVEAARASHAMTDESPGTRAWPALRVPAVRVPTLRLPTVRLPTVRLPTVRLPTVRLPTVRLPTVRLPTVRLPPLRLPRLRVPRLRVPPLRVPPLRVPPLRLPLLRMPAVAFGAARAAGLGAKQAAGQIAARLPYRVLGRLLAVAAAATAVAVAINTGSPLYLLYVGVSFTLSAIAWTTLVWMVSAWRTPAALVESGLSGEALAPAHSFSLIVPARHEETVLEATLSRLMTSDHPAFEVLVVVGDDDPGTREVAERVADHHSHRMRVVVDASRPKSKPKALNAALPYCSGAITGVFDAEDDVHPALLERVDQCFQKTHADVVQAGVQLMNFRSSWLTVRNVLEYYFWFRSRLHFHARQGFIPLGGNTVFIRTEVLRAVSGWDPECLAEDCELGVRLSALGARTAVFYEPDLVTREECPPTLGAFAKQRTRWNQGYLQTLSKGHWRRLPLRQRALGAYTLAMPYLMAVVWVTIPVAIATALVVKAPVPITLVSFLPALPMVAMLAVEVAGLRDFCRTYGERASARDYGRLVIGLLLYQAVLAFAAVRAVARELRGDRGWEKTAHMGLHLSEGTVAREPSNGSPRGPAPPARPAPRAAAGCAVFEPSAVALAVREEPLAAAGNGHGHGSVGPRDDLFGVVNGEPLWARLGPVSTNGAAALPLPAGVRVAGRGSSGFRDRQALLRRALACRGDLLVLLALLVVIGFVQATNMVHWPNTQFDEGTYVANAWAVEHGALAPYTYSYGHPPLAWLLIALWTWVQGIVSGASYSLDTGRQLMFVVTMVSCSLLFVLARRLNIGRAFAAAAVLLFALSPLALYYHRAVLLDNIAIAWVLAAFVFALTPRRRLWAFAASGACFALGVLSKETTLVLLPALLLAVARNADPRTRRYCLTLFASLLGLIALTYPLYATLKGELVPGEGHVSLVGYTIVQLFTREATGSLLDPASETHAIVNYWLRLDPWLLGAALVLAPFALARRSTRAVALAFVIQVVMILRPGYLPNMYVLGLLPFAALIVAGTSDMLWRRSQAKSSAMRAWSARAPIAAMALVVVFLVAPGWVETDRHATSVRLDGPRRAAERWLVDNIGRDKRVIVGDEFWIHLIENGFDQRPVRGGFFSRHVVVYWPLDYDPAVKRRFPGGWGDFDYVVSTEAVRSTTEQTPTTRQALQHSHVIAQFGEGAQRIEVRKIGGRQRPDRWW